jgi:cobalamin biosynthesis protein CobT
MSRAPAPMPVVLPTEQDIFSGEGVEGDEYSPVPDDVEAAGVYATRHSDDSQQSQLPPRGETATPQMQMAQAQAQTVVPVAPILAQQAEAQAHPLADLLGDAPVLQPTQTQVQSPSTVAPVAPLIPSVGVSESENEGGVIVGEHSDDSEEEEEDDDDEEEDQAAGAEAEADDDEEEEDDDEEEEEDDDEDEESEEEPATVTKASKVAGAPAAPATAPAVAAPPSSSAGTSSPSSPTSSDIEGFETVEIPVASATGAAAVAK